MLPCRYGNSTIEPWPAGHILLRFACIMGKSALNHQYPWAYCPHIPVTWLISESAPTWGCSKIRISEQHKMVCICSPWDSASASLTRCPCSRVHQPDVTRNVHRELCVSSMAWPFHCMFFKMSVGSVEWPEVSLRVSTKPGCFSSAALQPCFCGTSMLNFLKSTNFKAQTF